MNCQISPPCALPLNILPDSRETLMAVTEEEVIWCYHSLLGRDPESAEAVLSHFHSAPDFRSLVMRFIGSNEFKQNQSSGAHYTETTKAIMRSVPEVHRADIFNESTKWFDYKWL